MVLASGTTVADNDGLTLPAGFRGGGAPGVGRPPSRRRQRGNAIAGHHSLSTMRDTNRDGKADTVSLR
jgi:hypothetical protein